MFLPAESGTLMATKAEQLASVQDAIMAIQNGAQSYTVDGHAVTRADLDTLYRREKYLESAIARQRTGGIRVRGVIPIDR